MATTMVELPTSSTKFYLDTCNGLLLEVPETFDNGRTKVQLSCLSISRNFIAMGSECGALFLYNRNLNRTVKPLRTQDNDGVTCIDLHASAESNFLAVGRKSGTVIIMCMPTEKIPKIRQSIQDDVHSKQSVTCVRWSPDGRRLYSADISGQVIAFDVDFDNNIYVCSFVADNPSPISFLECTNSTLFFSTMSEYSIFETKTLQLKFSQSVDTFGDDIRITGLSLAHEHPVVSLSNGSIYSIQSNSEVAEITYYRPENSNVIVTDVDGISSKQAMSFPSTDFQSSHFIHHPGTLSFHFWSADKYLIASTSEDSGVAFDFCAMLADDLVEVISVAFDPVTLESFLLSRSQKVYRLGTTPVNAELLKTKPPISEAPPVWPTYSILNSIGNLNLSGTTTTTASSFFSKLSGFKELEKITQNPKFSEIQSKLTESGSKLATDFMEQLKNSPLSTDYNATGKVPQSINKDLTVGSVESNGTNGSIDFQNPDTFLPPSDDPKPIEFVVKHREKVKGNRKIRERVYGDVRPEMGRSTEEFLKSISKKKPRAADDFDEKILEDIIRGEYTAPDDDISGLLTDGEASATDNEEDHKLNTTSGEEVNEIAGAFEQTVNNEPEAINSEVVLPSSLGSISSEIASIEIETVDSDADLLSPGEPELTFESAADEFVKQLQVVDEDEKIDEAAIDDDINVPSTSYEIIEAPPKPIFIDPELLQPEYTKISAIANHRADTWNTLALPHQILSFAISGTYIVIIPTKPWLRYPRYRIMDIVQNGLLGGDWTKLNYHASVIAVNDQGNLLWRISKGIAYAPCNVDEMCPESDEWTVQPTHGAIKEVVLTSENAWYLSDRGIAVNMKLPEMGILQHVESPSRIDTLTASDHAVWGLKTNTGTLLVRTMIDTQICPMGTDWVEGQPNGPKRLVAIALFEKTGFGVDEDGSFWFVNGVDERNPIGTGRWFQTIIPEVLSSPNVKQTAVKHWQIRVSSLGVFVSVGSHLILARQPITGHVFTRVIPMRLVLHDNFSVIACGSTPGEVFLCQPNAEIHLFSDAKRNLTSLPHFNASYSIVALSAAPQGLYVLDNCGQLCIRRGFNPDLTPLGTVWEKLSTESMGLAHAPICSIAASTNSLWAVTSDGSLFVATEALRLATDLHWTKIDTPQLSPNDKIDQVRVSANGKYVWVFSLTSGRAFARCQVDPGTGWKGKLWLEAPGDIKVGNLAVGENVVWALEQNTSRLWRVRNLFATNIVGIGWRKMPFILRAIAVDGAESRLWAIDTENRVVKHEMDVYPRKSVMKQNCRSCQRPAVSSTDSWVDLT